MAFFFDSSNREVVSTLFRAQIPSFKAPKWAFSDFRDFVLKVKFSFVLVCAMK